MNGAELYDELARRLAVYERSAATTSAAFVAVMGAAQAIGSGSPVGDMRVNRFCLPARTGPQTDIDIQSLQAAIAVEAQRVRDLAAPADNATPDAAPAAL